jgi:8-oxo-dGTP pyrophosphatase MutT (NUDIX family)
MIRCACLLVEDDQRILLVRVRDNALWYLPGGTIEAGESDEVALVREISEELGVEIDASSVSPAICVVGPAYGRDDDVELNCYTAQWEGEIRALAEISELGWFGPDDRAEVAPAVKLLFDELWSKVE